MTITDRIAVAIHAAVKEQESLGHVDDLGYVGDFEGGVDTVVDYALVAHSVLLALADAKPSEIILMLPTETLVAIVMRLTGGSVNPSLPQAQADRIKEKAPAV